MVSFCFSPFTLGSTQRPKIIKNKIPVAISDKPIGVTSNRPNVSIWFSGGNALFEESSKSLSRINGLEPTMVTVPPRMAQNPIGISNLDIGILVRRLIRLTTGKNSAAAPTFCIKLEMIPTVPDTKGVIRVSVEPPFFRIQLATRLMMPVLSSPAPIIITAIIDMTALLEKPSKSSAEFMTGSRPGTMVVRPSNTMMVTAATSIRTTSETKRYTVKKSRPSTRIISGVSVLASFMVRERTDLFG